MRRNRWLPPLILALSLAPSGLILPQASPTCDCARITTEEAFAQSSLVFAATVVAGVEPSVEDQVRAHGSPSANFSADMIRWALVPVASWKGEVRDTLLVYSPRYGASCGYGFQVGEAYIVFARAWPGGPAFPAHTTNLCSHTRPLTSAWADVMDLGAPLWERTEQ